MRDETIADLRRDYTRAGLHEEAAGADPFALFRLWFDQARRSDVLDANAMTLATVAAGGRPAARIVLLKEFDARGFVFFTNYTSAKGRELERHPEAALLFWWAELERQVRIEGRVERISPAESDAYFRVRPRGSQLGAWVSEQSEPIESRAWLERRLSELEARYAGREVPRPPHWGGFRLRPDLFEFWQGRPSRLHDRLRYRLAGEAWLRERLSP